MDIIGIISALGYTFIFGVIALIIYENIRRK